SQSILDPFGLTYPTAVQATLEGGALSVRFNPTGSLVAAGTWNGAAVVWDLVTGAQVRTLEGHAKKKQVTCVDWSRNSRYLLSAGKDWNVVVWDLSVLSQPLDRYTTIRFDQPVSSAAFHPRNSKIVLVVLASGEAFIVDTRHDHHSRIELCETIDESDEEAQRYLYLRSAITTAKFNPSGKLVFAGTAAGSLLVFNTRTGTMIGRHSVAGAGQMKQIAFARSGRFFITNSSDRILRQFEVPTYPTPSEDMTILDEELEPSLRFSDPINRVAWNGVVVSPDGEWLAGGAADAAGHKIYIWDLSSDGQFTATLDGGRELLVDLDWHPSQPCIASVTKVGDIIVFRTPSEERWGAFAGGFEEVDENVEYEEREDEFDIEDEDVVEARKRKAEEEPVDMDDDWTPHKATGGPVQETFDDDALWAEDDPDDDVDTHFDLPVLYDDEDEE
ncbi:WD40 repeat-like protein, partial [Exidia glandulosa HHB12029]